MTTQPKQPEWKDFASCPDCGVLPNSPHVDGCDVARCLLCGYQRISCEHEDNEGGWGQIWTGSWPVEVVSNRTGETKS